MDFLTSKKKSVLYSILSLLWLVSPGVFAAPNIIDATTHAVHGQSLAINGIDFGNKEMADPVMWDDGEDSAVGVNSAVIEKGWAQALPSAAGEPYDITYRATPYRNMPAPHNYSTKYLAGGHKFNEGCQDAANRGSNVVVTVNFGSDSDYAYATWYERVDDAWPDNDPNSAWDNYKFGALSSTGTDYFDPHYYINDVNNQAPQFKYAKTGILGWPYPSCSVGGGVECVCSTPWENNPSNFNEAMKGTGVYGNWIRREAIFYNVTSEQEGYWRYYVNNHLVWGPSELESATPSDDRCAFWTNTICGQYDCTANPDYARPSGFSVGGYWRDSTCLTSRALGNNDAFRYFDDVYIDNSISRVMLADAANYEEATIIEPQIPSSWSDGSITVTGNLGKFSASGIAFLFVFDAENNHNTVGYPVTIGDTSTPDTTAPASPAGLTVR